jgi:hypothetical protein
MGRTSRRIDNWILLSWFIKLRIQEKC